MEEQNQGNQKPLRHFSNKAKDIESIYGKSKTIKISENETEKNQINQEIETIKNEQENLLEQIEKLNEQINDLNSASEAGKNTTDIEAMNKGLEMITNKARKMFEDAGVKQMENIIGKPFDVNYHEALMMTNSELPEGSIVQVVQPGYLLNDKVLRYAKVITSNGNSN